MSREVTIEVDAEVLDWLVAHGYHPHYGARFLRREIERNVAAVLAEFLVREQPPRGSRVGLGVRRGRITARLVDAPDDRAAVTMPMKRADKRVKLDRESLDVEARVWVARWEGLKAEHEERQGLATRLIDASAQRGFWDDAEHAQEVLRRYKALDARLMADRRLLRPVRRLERLVEHPEEGTAEALAELVEEAALNYRRWLDIGASEQPGAAWLMLSAADSVEGAGEWLSDLVAMYRGWLRRQGYTYDLVAEEVASGEVCRLVFEVEGPGVLNVLSMESGEHRRKQAGRIERAVVEVVPRQQGGSGPADTGCGGRGRAPHPRRRRVPSGGAAQAEPAPARHQGHAARQLPRHPQAARPRPRPRHGLASRDRGGPHLRPERRCGPRPAHRRQQRERQGGPPGQPRPVPARVAGALTTPDVLVVGAGLAGCSVAWHLAPRARVLVLEQGVQPGAEASAQNAGMVRRLGEDPYERALALRTVARLDHLGPAFPAPPSRVVGAVWPSPTIRATSTTPWPTCATPGFGSRPSIRQSSLPPCAAAPSARPGACLTSGWPTPTPW